MRAVRIVILGVGGFLVADLAKAGNKFAACMALAVVTVVAVIHVLQAKRVYRSDE